MLTPFHKPIYDIVITMLHQTHTAIQPHGFRTALFLHRTVHRERQTSCRPPTALDWSAIEPHRPPMRWP